MVQYLASDHQCRYQEQVHHERTPNLPSGFLCTLRHGLEHPLLCLLFHKHRPKGLLNQGQQVSGAVVTILAHGEQMR